MYDECCCSKSMSSAHRGEFYDRLRLARAFALVGVLKNVDDSVPLDLVYVYLRDIDNSGLSCIVLDNWGNNVLPIESKEHVYDPVHGDVNESKDRRRLGYSGAIPDSLKNMAHEFMVRCFWDQVSSIYDIIEDTYTTSTDERLYPTNVRNALDGLDIADESSIYDIKHDIATFHSAVIPLSSDVSRQFVRDDENSDLGVLTIRQMQKLYSIKTVLWKFMDSYMYNNRLPDQMARNTLCDILDCLLILKGPCVYRHAHVIKTTYEYAKLGASYTNTKNMSYLGYNYIYRTRDGYSGKVSGVMESYSHMSAHAAICVGTNISYPIATAFRDYSGNKSYASIPSYDYIGSRYPFRSLLKKINPHPITDVKLFMIKELELQKMNLEMDECNEKGGRECRYDCPVGC